MTSFDAEAPSTGEPCEVSKGLRAPKAEDIQRSLKKSAASRGRVEIAVQLKIATPVLGGAAKLRKLNDVDVIRVPTVRGHLRFWWRALNAHAYTARELYQKESELWGRAAQSDGRGRSQVDISVSITEKAETILDADAALRRTAGYAVWPAREPYADIGAAGTLFSLRVSCLSEREDMVRAALAAWIVFGGYGSRTRRGLGSLTVTADPQDWLPSAATAKAFENLFARNVFQAENGFQAALTPCLSGATLCAGSPVSAENAWLAALGWLNEFRQGPRGGHAGSAREPHSPFDRNRPSVSNWPEADKIRHLQTPPARKSWWHTPRHNAEAVWPRAEFGLPIGVKFQDRARIGTWQLEPGKCEIVWKAGGELRDRLASPLIVKALPLANGQFVPCALWLSRAMPKDAEVGLHDPGGALVARSAAKFGQVVAAGDAMYFSALAGKTSVKEAFFDWLVSQKKAARVAL